MLYHLIRILITSTPKYVNTTCQKKRGFRGSIWKPEPQDGVPEAIQSSSCNPFKPTESSVQCF